MERRVGGQQACSGRRVAGVAALGLLLLLNLGGQASAQSSSIGLISALVGEGVVTHAATDAPLPLKLDDQVFLKDRIETKERSVARVLFGGRITVTIRERSVVTITDDPAHPRVELETGKLALKVHQNGLRPGEVAEIHTPNSITGIRGSLVVAEVAGLADNPDSHITVLEAHHPITVAARNNPNQLQSLRPGQALTVSGPRHNAQLRPVRRITREHALREAEAAEVPGRPRDGGEEHRYGPRPARYGPNGAQVHGHSRAARADRPAHEREGASPAHKPVRGIFGHGPTR